MKADERRALYDAVFNTPNGTKVLEDLAKAVEFKHSSFNADGVIMAHREGKKDTFRYIQKQLEAK